MPLMVPSPVKNGPNIWIAVAEGDKKRVVELLDSGVIPDVKDDTGYTPLHAASSYSHDDILRMLVERGGNVNIQDEDGETPLFVCESIGTAKLLISLGADPSIRNSEGLMAAERIAAEEEFLQVADFIQSQSGNSRISRNYNTQDGLSLETRARIQHLLSLGESAERDEELQSILMEAARNIRERNE